MSGYSISLIIPVYNEEKIIEASFLKNLKVLNSRNIDFEIIIVNDGSKDNCRTIIEKLSKSYNLKVVEHPFNMGFGAAIRTGIQNSINEYILCVPSDSPLDEENFLSFEEIVLL